MKFCKPIEKEDYFVLNWDFITICQLKCSYCYARNDKYKNSGWGKFQNIEQINKILKFIKSIDQKLKIVIVGGEPTLHPKCQYILDQLNTFENVKKIEFFSNCVLIDKIKLNKKCILFASFHPEYNYDDNIINQCLKLKNQGIKFEISAMIIQNDKCFNIIKKFEEKCKKNGIKINNFIFPYKKEKTFITNEYFNKIENIKRINLNGEKYTIPEIFYNNLNNFYHWTCKINSADIDIFGNFKYMCIDKSYNIFNEHFIVSPKNVICNKKCCGTECGLMLEKWKK